MAIAAVVSLLLLAQPGDPRALFEEAMAAQSQGRLAEAAKLLESAAKAAPGNFAVFGNLGAVRAQLGDFDGALDAYRQALALNPGVARLHLNIGIAHVRRGRFVEALAALDRFLAAEPANMQGRELRALCLFQLARYPESTEAYRQLATDHGEPLAALYGWGQSLLKTGDRPGAERVFERLFARHGATAEASLLEAQMMMSENRLEEALAKLNSLAAGPERLRGVDLWRGITLEGLGRAAEARAAYRAEFDATGDLVAAYALGVLAGRDGDEREALRWLDRAQPIDAERYNVAYHRGRALLRLGDARAAVNLLEQSARRNPRSVPERYLLLQAYQKLGRAADAQRVSMEIRRLRAAELRKDQTTVEGSAKPKQKLRTGSATRFR
jgi:tetratricopeptide (TPR) repeat protein